MLTIKKLTLKKSVLTITSLALLIILVALFSPNQVILAEDSTCGNGVCDYAVENNDLCPEDCHCTDNGTIDPGEGCACKDVICEGEGETSASACGTSVGNDNGECPAWALGLCGVCPEGLSPVPGGQGSLICWDACICQGFCGQDGGNGGGGGGGGPCTCPPHPNPGQVDTGCSQSEPNPCPGGFTSGGNWACWGTGTHSSTAGSAGECCAGSWSAVFVGHECD